MRVVRLDELALMGLDARARWALVRWQLQNGGRTKMAKKTDKAAERATAEVEEALKEVGTTVAEHVYERMEEVRREGPQGKTREEAEAAPPMEGGLVLREYPIGPGADPGEEVTIVPGAPPPGIVGANEPAAAEPGVPYPGVLARDLSDRLEQEVSTAVEAIVKHELEGWKSGDYSNPYEMADMLRRAAHAGRALQGIARSAASLRGAERAFDTESQVRQALIRLSEMEARCIVGGDVGLADIRWLIRKLDPR